jgi:hypothetical protein
VLVEVDVHHAVFASGHLPLFFGIRQQQILRQPPIEEHANAVDFNNFQTGKFTDLNFWFFSSSEKFVIAVQINKYVEPVFIFAGNIFRDITIGQKDFAVRTTVQI